MQIRTLNQIVNELKEIANQHLQINSFHAGTLDDFATSGDTRYPAMWVTYENAAIGEKTEAYSFTLFIVDRVKKDRSNLIEVHSDCKSILNDIKAQLNAPGYGWSLTQDWNYQALFEPFMEDEVAGWFADITITQAFSNDTCQIPFNQEPIPGLASTQPTNGSVISSYVPTSRTITINGITYDLSTDRSWTITGTTGVPYTGATQDVDLGSYGLNADYVSFNLNPTSSIGAGKIIYDGGTGALSYYLNNSTVTSYIGETQHAYVHNAEAIQINKGEAVYLYQASGNKASIKLAYNTTDATSAKTFGLAAENIGAGQNGIVICQGRLQGLNTGMFNEGDSLYLGATAGTLTSTKPYAPNHMVSIGVVERANNGNGQIYVKVANGFEIEELHNVSAQNPTDNDIIVYSSGTSLWTKKNIYTAINLKRDYLIAGNQTTTSNLASSITELVYSASANKRYSINGYIRVGCNNTGGVKLSITIPSGATMAIALNGIQGSGTSLLYTNIITSNTLIGAAYNSFNGTSIINVSGEVELSSTAGNIQFNFASNTNLQTSTIYQQGTLLNFIEL